MTGNNPAPSPTELSVVKVLRPYKGFEYDYSRIGPPAVTVSGSYPIAFSDSINPNPVTPPGQTDPFAYDEQARQGVAGYDPHLTAMVPVPVGASVLIWLPCVPFNPNSLTTPDSFMYVWRIMWRFRNMGDFRRRGLPWSIGQEAYGASDSSSGVAEARVVIPAASESTIYVRREPSISETSFVFQHVHAEGIATRVVNATNSPLLGLPVQPGGSAPLAVSTVTLQQGIIDPLPPLHVAHMIQPPFIPIWTKAAGNELGIWCYKYLAQDAANAANLVPTNWDFQYDTATGLSALGADDAIFSRLFGAGSADGAGNANMGVYVGWGHTGI